MLRRVVLVFLLLLCPSLVGAQDGAPPAPYQVDGLIRFKDDRHRLGGGLDLNEPMIVVDLGEARTRAHPDAARWRSVTVIGTEGMSGGKLEDIRKVCDYLCGDSAEECHYQALIVLDGPIEEIGTPLAAVPGTRPFAGFLSVSDANDKEEAKPPYRLSGDDFTPLAWTAQGEQGAESRIAGWNHGQRRLDMQFRWPGGDVFSVAGQNCSLRNIDALTEVDCDGVALILADGAPLLFSYPDYNAPAAEVVARFTLKETSVYLVRLGLKAQTVFGFLYADGARWRGAFRPRDYALLC